MEVDDESFNLNVYNICTKCQELVDDPIDDPAIPCSGHCQQISHIRCLVSNCLLGDVFYEYFCSECSETEEEMVVRQKLPWLTAVIIALHNLRTKSIGLSRRNYFHWKSHITQFIDRNWEILFTNAVKRSKTWRSTVSSNLSSNRGVFFESGTAEFNEAGWWKLIKNDPPKIILDNHNKAVEEEKAQETNKIGSGVKEILDLGLDEPNLNADFPSFYFVTNSVEDSIIPNNMTLPENFMTEESMNPRESLKDEIDDSSEDENIDVAVTNFKENYVNDDVSSRQDFDDGSGTDGEFHEIDENSQNEDVFYPSAEPSLFTQSSSQSKPWDETVEVNDEANISPLMSIQEEEYYLDKIEKYKNLLYIAPPEVKQLYRKLAVRKKRRELGLPILNIDALEKNNTVLDNHTSENHYNSQNSNIRLAGRCLETDSVYSSHTKRLLPHFIKRHEYNYSESPLWFKVMTDLLIKVNKKSLKSNCTVPNHAMIDYCYIKPQHLPAVNRLCSEFFWQVDVGDCLSYPDFTVVALYKKLVIGCGIMVPDADCNEAYIQFLVVRPEWRRAGIATSMLYHLYQTCMSNDITLHVSVSNPAAILYEKFGFKKEELVLNFYDKYLPPSSKDSRNAFFYRLAR